MVVASVLVVAAVLFLWLGRQRATRTEAAYWESIRSGKDAAVFEAYLKRYPKGRFVAAANIELEALRRALPSRSEPTVPVEPKSSAPVIETKGTDVKPPSPPVGTLRALGQRVNPKDGLVYLKVPPGTFQMGCLPEDPCDC